MPVQYATQGKALRMTEIFLSLQGESTFSGLPTVFIRLTGCPLRCFYCDTSYAFSGGKMISIHDTLKEVDTYNTPYVTVTGGEPLAQKNCTDLLDALNAKGKRISLETGGALDISEVNRSVVVIMDLKTPASGECQRNLYANIAYLKPSDEVKFVIEGRRDYEWAKSILSKYRLMECCHVLFSPSHLMQDVGELADWIIEDCLLVRLQIQLHKYLWKDTVGR